MHPDYACWKQYGPLHEFNPGKYFLPNAQFPFQHQGKRWVLIGNTDGLKRKALRVSGAAFAHAGRELLSVVDIEPMPKFTERLKAHFAKSGYQMIQSCGKFWIRTGWTEWDDCIENSPVCHR